MMRQFRFIGIAFLVSLFVINAVFWRKVTATLLCGVLGFNSVSCYSFLGDPGRADAAISLSRTVTASDHAGGVQKDEQEVAICLFGVCADIPKIPVLAPKSPNQNPPNSTASPQQLVNGVQEQLTASNHEKPTIDLTGAWDTDRLGSICSVDRCILATPPVPSLTVSDKTARVISGITITQSGNQISIPERKYAWDGGHYTYQYEQGNISGNQVTVNEKAIDTSVGWGYTNIYNGIVSADGNTVEGEVVYQPSTGNNGNNTAKTKFTWKRKNALSRVNAVIQPDNALPTTTLTKKPKEPSNPTQKTPQTKPRSAGGYPCADFSVDPKLGKIPSDIPTTVEEKKEFEFAQPSNPGLIVPNYLYKQGNIPDRARLAKAYGGDPNDWNEHRSPGFMLGGRTIYLRWFRNRYSVRDYEYKFVADCKQAKNSKAECIAKAVKWKSGKKNLQKQIAAVQGFLDAIDKAGITNIQEQSYILATADWESNGFLQLYELAGKGVDANTYFENMYGVDSGKNKRLNLGNTQFGDGYAFRGHGYVQVTGRGNYQRLSDMYGQDFVNNPDLLADTTIAAQIAVEGMRDGLFTGKKLDDYLKDNTFYSDRARAIINGKDHAVDIANKAREIEKVINHCNKGE